MQFSLKSEAKAIYTGFQPDLQSRQEKSAYHALSTLCGAGRISPKMPAKSRESNRLMSGKTRNNGLCGFLAVPAKNAMGFRLPMAQKC
ncbi:hypothetical protein ACQ3G6_08950 [Allorhizobium undicola]|uniref:hypothetical protein n=1 Tax=Allorhizobium undicola TaxID=78527 RepID=UPI003D34524B